MLKRIIIPVLLLTIGFGTMLFLASFKKDQKRMSPRPVVRTVLAVNIHYDKISPAIETMGRIAPLEKVALTPEVSGIIQQKPFRLYQGVSFRTNDILCVIDSSQTFLGYRATISDLQNAVAGLIPEFAGNLPDALERWQRFFSHLSDPVLPALPATASEREKLLATRYSVYKLYYSVRQIENTLEKFTLRAPFNGTVESTLVYPSSMAKAAVTMATLVRTDVLEIEAALPLAQLPFIAKGSPAAVFLNDGSDSATAATVQRISNIADDRMQTVAVFIRIEPAVGTIIHSGAYARVRLPGTVLDHAITVPRKALYANRFVYTIEADTLARHTVSVACMSIDSAYCTGGIEEGARLIVEPMQDAVIGMAVQDEATALKRAAAAAHNGAAPKGNHPGESSGMKQRQPAAQPGKGNR